MPADKYLTRYSEKETALFEGFPFHYDHVLCIPAFAESETILENLRTATPENNVLVILVVNAPDNAEPEKLAQTQALADSLKRRFLPVKLITDSIALLRADNENFDLLLVERCRSGNFLDSKYGVGLARKIACDIALKLITSGNINSPWIHTTDADTTLPEDYFPAIDCLDPDTDSAGIYPFFHTTHPDKRIDLAQQLYDCSLQYYVDGLCWAGSPYAFHTIGSTLVINARHYSHARGFPRRQAGEDFYLLNKLAKLGKIKALESTPLKIRSRISDRVPFGTGPGLNRILTLEDPLNEFLFYHPQCFVYLRCWLALANTLWREGDRSITTDVVQRFIKRTKGLDTVEPEVLAQSLLSLEVDQALAHAFTHSKQEDVFQRHLHHWFDAFRTLKLIHRLREDLPSLPLALIRDETYLPFVEGVLACAPTRQASSRLPR